MKIEKYLCKEIQDRLQIEAEKSEYLPKSGGSKMELQERRCTDKQNDNDYVA